MTEGPVPVEFSIFYGRITGQDLLYRSCFHRSQDLSQDRSLETSPAFIGHGTTPLNSTGPTFPAGIILEYYS